MDHADPRTAAARAVQALQAAGLIDPGNAEAGERVVAEALGGAPAAHPQPGVTARGRLVEIAGYLGGALVLAAVALFVAQEWASLTGTVQVTLLAGAALVLALAGLAVASVGSSLSAVRSGAEPVRRRLASALLTGGGVATGFAVGQAVSLSGDVEEPWPIVVGAATAALAVGLGYAVVRSAAAVVVAAAAALQAVGLGTTSVNWDGDSLPLTIGVLALGLAWLALTESGLVAEQAVGRVVALGQVLFGAQLPLFDGEYEVVAYVLTALVGLGGFAVYLRTVAWPYLVVGVLAVTLVVPEVVVDWAGDSLGVAGAVLVAGLSLLGASLLGLRVRRSAPPS